MIVKNEELDKLALYLMKHGYKCRRHRPDSRDSRNYVIVYDADGRFLWDAICQEGSYGFERGLLEVMGTIANKTVDDVEGYLTSEEIINRLEYTS